MKEIENIQKRKESVSNLLNKVTDSGKKIADGVQKGAKSVADKAKKNSYLRKMKKYNPLFPEQYNSNSFNKPNLIMIVDDAVRREIDVCQGSIGWLNKDTGVEILYLYDEYVKESEINFIPTATCDELYYVDNFDRNCFIRIDHLFAKAHEEKLAELEHIAHSLGAKSCAIEIAESNAEIESNRRFVDMKSTIAYKRMSVSSSESQESNLHKKNTNQRSGKTVTVFEGSDTPVRPTLKWFSYDENIKKLIDMRCSNDNSIKSRTLELMGSSYATMSLKTASSIDQAVNKMGNKASVSMEKQATKENLSKLIFSIEF